MVGEPGQGALASPGLEWPSDAAILLVRAEGARAQEALLATLRALLGRLGQGVLVTANRPAALLRDAFAAAGLPADRLVIVDCVSSLAAIRPPPRDGVLHVESPALLEKVALRAGQALARMQGPRFLAVDSLSALEVYAGPAPVAELARAWADRLRAQGVAGAFLVVGAQEPPGVEALCDAAVRPG